jgi:broad specificity phosphatase PhoE
MNGRLHAVNNPSYTMPVPKFIFVRHGEAEHNVAAHGPEGDAAYTNEAYKDASLTQTGITQARSTGEALACYNIIDIWSSPLTRCIQTSLELFEETSAQDLYLHDSLIEVLGGGHICNDRKPRRELKKSYALCHVENLPDLPPMWAVRENAYSVTNRMMSLCLLLAEIYKDSPENSYLVLTSHWGAIHTFTGKALKNAEYVIKSLEEILARE